jgi:hypothetical protein
MRERALAEALRLGAGRFTLDRSLTLALLRSANGWLESKPLRQFLAFLQVEFSPLSRGLRELNL